MATNTRRAARQREGGSGPSESQDRTEGAESRSRLASESAAMGAEEQRPSYTPTPRPGETELEDRDEEISEAFEAEEDELEYYAGLAQDQLERRLHKTQSLVMRKRKERELMQLRKELRGDAVADLRVADETPAPEERGSKRRRSSESDDARQTKRQVRPAEPLYYNGKSIKELEEFLIFWVIQWEAQPGEPEATRVRTAARYLRGTPMKLWGQRIQSDAAPIKTWEEFKQWLRDSLKAPNQRILESTLALKEMRQRENQTCKDVYVYMCELENNIPTMNDDRRRAWALVNALRPELRSRVVRDLQAIDNVDEVLACAGRNESTLTERNPSRGARDTHRTEPKSDDLLPIRRRIDRGRGSYPRSRFLGSRGGSTQASRERDIPPISRTACWNCGKEGHRSNECPEAKESKNA
jgi:Zinc knuckle